MAWTLFWDGGENPKLPPFDRIYIEARKATAVGVFKAMFGRDPFNVTCRRRGEDYSVFEHATLEEASAYHRNVPLFYDESKDESVYVERGQPVPASYVLHSFYEKRGPWDGYQTLEEYLQQPSVCVIRATAGRYAITGPSATGPDAGSATRSVVPAAPWLRAYIRLFGSA